MVQLKEGMKVYCDLHYRSKVHTIVSLAEQSNGWAIVDDGNGRTFYWPLVSCFPVETTKLPKYDKRIAELFG